MANPFDQFDAAAPAAANPFDQFDAAPEKPAAVEIDFDRPVEAVRADIKKLSGKARAQALRAWADAYVKKEGSGTARGIDDYVRAATRGTFVGPLLDEANALTNAAQNAIGLGGAPYDESLAYQRARDRAFDSANPIASTATQIGGALLGGGAALKAGGLTGLALSGPFSFVKPAQKLSGRILQGGALGTGYAAWYGAGNAEGGEGTLADQASARAKAGLNAAPYGTLFGAGLPAAAAAGGLAARKVGDTVSPVAARWGAWARQNGIIAQEPRPRTLSAAGMDEPPPLPTPAEAGGQQIIANQLARANVGTKDLRQRLAEVEQSRLFYSGGEGGSRAQNVTTLADLDPSLQRLAGAVARQQPEAGNIASGFLFARQTGQPPATPLAPNAGLPTRRPMAPIDADSKPAGQFERVRDALRRAFTISDSEFHGHKGSGYKTEQSLIAEAKKKASENYGAFYKAADNMDIRPYYAPAFQKLEAAALDEPAELARAMQSVLKQFRTPKGDLVWNAERFDKAKQVADGIISRYYNSIEGRNKYIAGRLDDMLDNLVGTIDAIKSNGIGEKYANARAVFSSDKKMQEALELGRRVFSSDDGEALLGSYAALSEGQKKLARLGAVQSFDSTYGRQARTADITRAFTNPRIQSILEELIPRIETATGRVKKGATFANRPERFGDYIANEQRFIQTRNKVVGGSPTDERMLDSKALDVSGKIAETLDTIRRQPSVTGIALRGIEASLNKIFGFRADSAAEVAKMLFTADPATRDRVLLQIEQRLGPSRMAQFEQILSRYQTAVTQSSGGAVGGARSGDNP